MDIQKVIKICKKCRQYIVIPGEKKVQWLGNDTAQYCISNHPKFTPEYLTAMAELEPQEVEISFFKTISLPEGLDNSDYTDDENTVQISSVTVVIDDEKYIPLYTSKGLRFLNAKYLEPFKKDEFDIYERFTQEGRLYFAVKVGMFCNAIIEDEKAGIRFDMVHEFDKLAKQLKNAYDVLKTEAEIRKEQKKPEVLSNAEKTVDENN